MTYAESNGGAGGLLALCFGVFTAVLGGLLATNWHGFAARFLPDARTPDAGQRQIPPWRRAPGPRGEAAVPVLLRVLGGFFAVAGAVITVVGISLLAHGDAGSLFTRGRQPEGVTAFIYPAFAVLWLIRFWRPGGLSAAAFADGGSGRRLAAALGTVCIVGFALLWYEGFTGLTSLTFLVGVSCFLWLAFSRSRPAGAADAADRARRGESDS